MFFAVFTDGDAGNIPGLTELSATGLLDNRKCFRQKVIKRFTGVQTLPEFLGLVLKIILGQLIQLPRAVSSAKRHAAGPA